MAGTCATCSERCHEVLTGPRKKMVGQNCWEVGEKSGGEVIPLPTTYYICIFVYMHVYIYIYCNIFIYTEKKTQTNRLIWANNDPIDELVEGNFMKPWGLTHGFILWVVPSINSGNSDKPFKHPKHAWLISESPTWWKCDGWIQHIQGWKQWCFLVYLGYFSCDLWDCLIHDVFFV